MIPKYNTNSRRQRFILRRVFTLVAISTALYLVSAVTLVSCTTLGFGISQCTGFVKLVLELLLAFQQDPSQPIMVEFPAYSLLTTGSRFTILQGVNTNSPLYVTEQKNWTGSDGKLDANRRTRYNAYSMTLLYKERRRNVGGYILDPAVDVGFPDIWTSNDTLLLQQKLLQSVKRHSFNLAVAAGEGKATVRLLGDTAATVYHTIRDLRRGNVVSAIRRLGIKPQRGRPPSVLTAKSVSGRWLELQYGWLPLFSDCYEAMRAYHQIAAKPRINSYRVARRKHVVDTVSYIKGPCNRVTTEIRSILYKQTEVLSTPRQLGLIDPLSLAWELLPFSFVADWFIPVGTYFDNLAQIPNLSGSFCNGRLYKSTINEVGISYWSGMKCSARSVSSSRNTLTQSVPRPNFKTLDAALNLPHLTNALALLRSIF